VYQKYLSNKVTVEKSCRFSGWNKKCFCIT